MVQVTVDGETITAPLAPDAFSNVSVDRIEAIQIAISNNQTVPVIVDGNVVEGMITGLSMGQTQAITLQADGPTATRMEDIYSALDVGEDVIRANGHTEPLLKQVQAAMVVFLSMLTIYLITSVRRRMDEDEHQRLYRWLQIGRVALGLIAAVLIFYLMGAIELNQQAAAGISALDEDQFKRAYAFATGAQPRAALYAADVKAQLLYWPQMLMIATGALLIGMAYILWQGAIRRETKRGFLGSLILAVSLMVGGWLLFGELPRTLGLAGREATLTKEALIRTAMYSIGTVPVQLALGLMLAYLLFSEVGWGKSIYRVIYFMPYIAPSVATSTVFLIIFRPSDSSLANQALSVLGIDPLQWLKEPNGIVRIFYSEVLGGDPLNIPKQLQGPSLALFTVILYNIWVFAGYNAVIFLAGLGAIPGELYEAAEVDGAGRWARFRSITLPLLSPTTFFLSMLSIIGTFKAFAHIYVLRRQATGQEIDTMSIYIFNSLYSANDPGYAAALAFVLFGVILILTMVQNRLAREQVFYG
jgi:multiple sugar transport system permease protein